MNCEQVRDLLIDLLYDELDPALRRPVAEHLRSCDECSARLADMQAARKSLGILRGDEPEALAFDPDRISEKGRAHRASRDRRPTRIRRILVASAAVAATILTGVTVWMLHEETTPPALASGPVEIRRVGVSLTILSRPEGWREWLQPQGVAQEMTQTSWRYGRFGVWRGMALVRDRRLIRNLPPGRTQVRFTGVPSGILPETVRLRSLDDPEGLTILEQNYQYDLASASAVLERYIDRPVAVTFKDGKSAAGKLLSFDAASLVIRPAGEGPRTIARDRVRDIAFEKLPEGLLTRPTLVWELLNSGPARQQFEVAYLTRGIMWRADYTLKLHPAKEVIGGQKPEITDTADLVGYATVTNNSGVTFEDAELKLLAGDVNLIRPEVPKINLVLSFSSVDVSDFGALFQEKSFFEYHLYTLGRATTIRDRETKQIELVGGSGIRMPRRYVYDPHRGHKTSPRVISELMNSEDNGLGIPLPKGTVRLYAPDPEGVQTYISATTIDHTPKDEKISFQWGHAFDIACSHRQVGYRVEGPTRYVTHEYEIRNHKDSDVTVTVLARVDQRARMGGCMLDGKDHPWYVREVGLVEIEVPVAANSARTVTLSHSYNPASGGGLSPTMRKGTSTRMASPP